MPILGITEAPEQTTVELAASLQDTLQRLLTLRRLWQNDRQNGLGDFYGPSMRQQLARTIERTHSLKERLSAGNDSYQSLCEAADTAMHSAANLIAEG